MPLKPSLFILCIDGGRFDVVKKWADDGHLPTFKRLMDNGVYGNIETILPGPHTALTWTSFATGKRPNKHGYLYTFMPQDDHTFTLFNSKSIRCSRLWDILSEKNLSVGVMDLPMTYPVSPVNGFMVSSLMVPAFAKDYTYPPELSTMMDRYGGSATAQCPYPDKSCLDSLYIYTKQRFDAIYQLLEEHPIDVFFKHIEETELINHVFSSYFNPSHPRHLPEHLPWIREYYEYLDLQLGGLMDRFKDSTFILFSDHGACPVEHKIYVNNLLKELGYFTPLVRKSKNNDLIKSIIAKGSILYGKLPFSVQKKIRGMIPKKLGAKIYKPITIDANWQDTKAYCFSWGMIFLNKSHKDYSPENHDKIVEDLYLKLNNHPLIKEHAYKVYKKEEIFGASTFDYFPDLYIYLHDNAHSAYATSKNVLIEPCKDMMYNRHTLYGLFFAMGPELDKNKHVDVNILDLTPTILHMLGLSVPSDMDGKVITELFSKDSGIRNRKIVYDTQNPEKKNISAILDEINF
jgi:predicted AlkP superfamily phosphohydrolase/phosphomutase